jgi:hypothetical protein
VYCSEVELFIPRYSDVSEYKKVTKRVSQALVNNEIKFI